MPKFESYVQGTPCWVELMAPDLPAAATFYDALFGWTSDEEGGGEGYLVGKLGGAPVAGLSGQMPEMAGHPAFWSVYLAVDDVDTVTAKVADAGGTVEAGPMDVPGAGRMSAIQDPTGARVNLWQAGGMIGTALANEPGTPIWNEVLTPDVDKAVAFYADVLGMGSEPMEGDGPPYVVLKNTDGAMVGGAMVPQMEGVPPHWNIYFNVADADATAAQVTELGGQVVAPNFDVPDIGRMGVYADPQGAMFCLMQNPPAS